MGSRERAFIFFILGNYMDIRNIAIIVQVDVVSLKRNSLKPSGFNTSATGKLPFSRPLSRQHEQ